MYQVVFSSRHVTPNLWQQMTPKMFPRGSSRFKGELCGWIGVSGCGCGCVCVVISTLSTGDGCYGPLVGLSTTCGSRNVLALARNGVLGIDDSPGMR